MTLAQFRSDYLRMAKPREIEEVGDTYLIRPLGFVVVQLLRRTTITPTAVSLASLAMGWWTAWLYFRTEQLGHITALAGWAAVALLFHSALDSADGQLARLKNLHTPLGRIIDGLCDNLAFIAIYVAIAVGYWMRVGDHLVIVLGLAVIAGVSHSIQSSLTDYQRLMYTSLALGVRSVTPPDDKEAQEKEGMFPRLLRALNKGHSGQQRAFLASTERLERDLNEWMRDDPDRRRVVQDLYARTQRGMLRPWALLAPNAHKLGIAASAFLPIWPDSLLGELGMVWYFMYDLALNAVMVGLIFAQARANTRTRDALRAVSPDSG